MRFRKRKLQRCFEENRQAEREFGKDVARSFILRVKIIQNSATLDDLFAQKSLRCHPLKGDRDGQYSMKLTGFMRLIFTVEQSAIEIVTIEEVSKHYDD